MSWPANPRNGDRVEIGGVLFEFDSLANAWNRVTALALNTTTDFLQVSNLLVTGNSTLGNIGNVKVTGGGPDQVISTDGQGNLYWKTEAVLTPAGTDKSVQYNANGNLGGDSSFTFTESTKTLSVPNIAGTIKTPAQPFITSVGTLGSLNVTGNITVGNVNASNLVSAQYLAGRLVANSGNQPNITNVGTLGNLTVSGNAVIAGNLTARTIYGDLAGNVLNGSVSVPGAPTQVLYNKANVLGADANLTFTNNNLLTIKGNLSAGNVVNANVISGNYIAGTLLTETQPNITSVGTLTSLNVSNDIDSQGNVNAVNFNGNVYADLVSASSITAPGGLNQILFNKNGYIGGSANLKFTGGNTVEIVGNIVSQNANLGNAVTANYFIGNLISSSQTGINQVGVLSELSVDGPISIANSFITIDNNSFVIGNIVPFGNKIYDLGTPINRWRDLYLSGTTISLGTTTITASQLGIATGPVTSNGQITTTTVGKPPFKVTSTVRVDNLNVQYLSGYEPDTANIADTIVRRDSNSNFGANVISANLDGWASLSGQVTSNSQPNITNVGNLTSLHVLFDANIDGSLGIGNTIYADLFDGDGANLGNINGANVSEVPNATFATTAALAINATNANHANLADYAVSNYQPNIREFDTLYSLRVSASGSGNITSDNANLGNLVKANYFQGNFNGTHSGTFTSPGGNTFILFNNQGNIDGAANLSFNPLTSTLAVHGTFNANSANISGDVVGNLFKGNGYALFNINGANVSRVANAIYADNAGNAEQANLANTSLKANQVTDPVQSNITGVGLLTNLAVDTPSLGYSSPISMSQTWNNPLASFTAVKINVSNVASSAIGSMLIDLQADGTSKFKVDKTGNIVSAANVTAQFIAGTLSTAAQPNITSLGNLTVANVTGNLTSGNANLGNLAKANYFQGDGSLLTNVPIAARLANGTSNINIIKDSNINFSVNSQSNVVVLSSNNVGNFFDITGNLSASNANLGNTVVANFIVGDGNQLGNLTGANVTGVVANSNYSAYAGNITIASQPNITSVGTLTGLTVNSTVTSNLGNLAKATYLQGVLVSASNAQPNITSVGTLVAGTKIGNATAFTNFGNGTLTTGTTTITNANITTDLFIGNGSSLFSIPGGNVTGKVANAAQADNATTAGTVTVAAQPNITSVGTLSGLNVSGNATISGNLTVQGNTNFVNVTTSAIQDPLIELGAGITYAVVSGGITFSLGNVTVVTASAHTLKVGDTIFVSGAVQTQYNGSFTVNAVTNATTFTYQPVTAPTISPATTLSAITVALNAPGSNDGFDRGLSMHYYSGAPVDAFMGYDNANAQFVVASNVVFGNNKVALYNTYGNLKANTFIGNINATSITAPGGATNNTYVLFNDAGNIGSNVNFKFDKANANFTVTGNILSSNASLGNTANANYFVGNLSNGTSQITITKDANINFSPNSVSNLVAITNTGLNINGTTLTTASSPALSVTQTWNNSTVDFTAIKANITNTASNTNSLLIDLQVGGTSRFKVDKVGNLTAGNISVTNIAGTLTTPSQTNITGVGTITTGVWQGTSIGTAYTDAKITNVTAGTGITVANTSGAITVTNSGVRTLTGSTGLTVTGTSNDVTLAVTYPLPTAFPAMPGKANQYLRTDTVNGSTLIWQDFTPPPYIANGTSNVNIPFATGTVASVTVTAGGSGYTSAPTVSFDLPPAGGVRATGTATILGGAVSAITVTNPGSGYFQVPAIIFAGGGGTGATATAVMTQGNVNISANGRANVLQIGDWGINTVGTLTAAGGSGGNITGANNIVANYFYGNWGSANANVNFSTDTQNVLFAANKIANVLQLTGVGAVFSANITTGGTGIGGNLTLANVISANTFIGAHGNGTSNLTFPVSGGAAVFNIGGALSAATITSTGITVGTGSAGNITSANAVTANWFIGNLGNGASYFFANVKDGNIYGNINGTEALRITSQNTIFASNIITGGTGVGGNLTSANVIVANTFTGNLANGSSNISIPVSSGPVNVSVGGTQNIVSFRTTGIVVGSGLAGDINSANRVSANYHIGNLVSDTGATSGFRFTGAGGSIIANVAGTDMLTIASTGTTVQTKLTVGAGLGGNIIGANVITANTVTLNNFITFKGTQEGINTSTGVGLYDLSTGTIFYHSSATQNFVATISNLPVITPSDSTTVSVTIMINQSGTPVYPTGVNIGGFAYTIKWLYGSVPYGTPNSLDIFSLDILRLSGVVSQILGSYTTYS